MNFKLTKKPLQRTSWSRRTRRTVRLSHSLRGGNKFKFSFFVFERQMGFQEGQKGRREEGRPSLPSPPCSRLPSFSHRLSASCSIGYLDTLSCTWCIAAERSLESLREYVRVGRSTTSAPPPPRRSFFLSRSGKGCDAEVRSRGCSTTIRTRTSQKRSPQFSWFSR